MYKVTHNDSDVDKLNLLKGWPIVDVKPSVYLTRPTERQLEILQLAATGHCNKEIALRLGVTLFTVKGHWTSILRRLSAIDRTHAVVIAIVCEWLDV